MLSNLISRLRNGQMVYHVNVPFEEARFCNKILDILWDKGLIRGYTKGDNGAIKISLLYEDGSPLIKRMTVLSRPSCRLYLSCLDLSRLLLFEGVLIMSTTKGIMTAEEAIRKGQGGEILVYFE
uniref:ribosomal protein S8 n=1 Tax=Microzonia abyssicola TaxID=217214 RepID=UPI002E75B682|nr:ribosomal protein S8 [Syringoderma abyssicola]WBP70358.1 ribosomal protein S8 [Syringoderma abyssicola]